MKTRRIASSIALAAALALGTTGCSLFAAQSTQEPYAPSDGIDVNIDDIAIRNLMLIADATGKNFNVVFTGVNNTKSEAIVRMTFVNDSSEASSDFALSPGLSAFGSPEGEFAPQMISLPGVIAGASVEAYFESSIGGEAKYKVPVLDGTLEEYKDYVLSSSQLRQLEDSDSDSDSATGSSAGAGTEDAATATEEAAE